MQMRSPAPKAGIILACLLLFASALYAASGVTLFTSTTAVNGDTVNAGAVTMQYADSADEYKFLTFIRGAVQGVPRVRTIYNGDTSAWFPFDSVKSTAGGALSLTQISGDSLMRIALPDVSDVLALSYAKQLGTWAFQFGFAFDTTGNSGTITSVVTND